MVFWGPNTTLTKDSLYLCEKLAGLAVLLSRKILKSKIAILVLNRSPINAVFPIVWFAGDPKTALIGDLLYLITGEDMD